MKTTNCKSRRESLKQVISASCDLKLYLGLIERAAHMVFYGNTLLWFSLLKTTTSYVQLLFYYYCYYGCSVIRYCTTPHKLNMREKIFFHVFDTTFTTLI